MFFLSVIANEYTLRANFIESGGNFVLRITY